MNTTTVFGSTKRSVAQQCVPPQLELKVAFGELKLDLRDALFPPTDVVLVTESLCASLEVLLPEGVTVVDHSQALLSSHAVRQSAEGSGPRVYVDGWSVCSDVKILTRASEHAMVLL